MIEQEKLDALSNAIELADTVSVKRLLEALPELVNADLRPVDARDHFTNGQPLYRAALKREREVIEVLLNCGADPNAAGSNPDDQPEFGLPLCLAVSNEDHDLVKLLLEHGASPNAYPYCSQSAIEVCFYKARSEGIGAEVIRHAYKKYLADHSHLAATSASELLSDHAGKNSKTLVSLIDRGGQLPFSAIVRDGFHDLAMEILKHSENENGTPHDHPNSMVINNIFGAARWYGYPKLLRQIMDHIGDDYKYESALQTIDVAIGSHNRDGCYADYREIIVMQLEYLKSSGQLEKAISDRAFNPLHKMATDFTWHSNYGYRAEIAKPESFVDLAELFVSWGFGDIHFRHSETELSTLSAAAKRGHHPGVATYVKWLLENGAEVGDAILIAKEEGHEEIVKLLSVPK